MHAPKIDEEAVHGADGKFAGVRFNQLRPARWEAWVVCCCVWQVCGLSGHAHFAYDVRTRRHCWPTSFRTLVARCFPSLTPLHIAPALAMSFLKLFFFAFVHTSSVTVSGMWETVGLGMTVASEGQRSGQADRSITWHMHEGQRRRRRTFVVRVCKLEHNESPAQRVRHA